MLLPFCIVSFLVFLAFLAYRLLSASKKRDEFDPISDDVQRQESFDAEQKALDLERERKQKEKKLHDAKSEVERKIIEVEYKLDHLTPEQIAFMNANSEGEAKYEIDGTPIPDIDMSRGYWMEPPKEVQ